MKGGKEGVAQAAKASANRAAESRMPAAAGAGAAAGLLGLQRLLGNATLERLAQNRSAVGDGGPLPEPVAGVVASGGVPLDGTVRGEMEQRLGHDLAAVRIHTDAWAAESARSVGATAYTVGEHVVFDAGAFAPGSASGRRLLAHELAHVVQQRRGGPPPSPAPGSALEQEADAVGARAFEGGGPVAIHGASGVGVARQAKPEQAAAGAAEVVEEAKEPQVSKLLEEVADLTAKFEKYRGTVDDIANDPAVKDRLSEIASRSGKAQDVIDALRGELTEEAMNREIEARLKTGADLKTILPEEVGVKDVEFIPGDRIRDLDGGKVTDGMLVRRRGDALEVITVFETKAGEASARELHLKPNYAKDPEKVRAKGKEPTKKQVEDWQELQREKAATPKGKVIQQELGGQIRVDIERLREDGRIRLRRVDPATGKVLDTFDVVKVKVTTRTLFVGVAPADVSLSAQRKALAKEPGIRFQAWNLKARKAELEKAAKDMRAAADKLAAGAPTAGAAKPASAKAPSKKPAAQAPAKPGAGAAGAPAPPAQHGAPAAKAAEEAVEPAPKAKPAEAGRPPSKKAPAAPARRGAAGASGKPAPGAPQLGSAEKALAAESAEAVGEAAERVGLKRVERGLARQAVKNFLVRRVARQGAKRLASLVPLAGAAVSIQDIGDGIQDIAHGEVVLGLYSIGIASVDILADTLHVADVVSGPGGSILSVTIQSWTTAQQIAIASGRAETRARELGDYLEKHGKLPPRSELMDYYGLNDEEVMLLEHDVARSGIAPRISAHEVRERLRKRIEEIEEKVRTGSISQADLEALSREREELFALVPGVEEAVKREEAEEKARKEREERARKAREHREWLEWKKRMEAAEKAKREPPPPRKGPPSLSLAEPAPAGPAVKPGSDPFGLFGGGMGPSPHQQQAEWVKNARFWGMQLLEEAKALRGRLSGGNRPSAKELKAFFAKEATWRKAAHELLNKVGHQPREALGAFLDRIKPQLDEVLTHLGK